MDLRAKEHSKKQICAYRAGDVGWMVLHHEAFAWFQQSDWWVTFDRLAEIWNDVFSICAITPKDVAVRFTRITKFPSRMDELSFAFY